MSDARDDVLTVLLRNRYGPRRESVSWSGVDPRELIAAASAHGVIREVYAVVAADRAAPPELVNPLRCEYLLEHGRAAELAMDVARLSAHFRGHGIPALFVKGPALAAQLYGHAAARSSGDADVLVEEPAVGAARRLLERLGHSLETTPPLDPTEKHLLFRHRETQRPVELHWRLWPSHQHEPFDAGALWQRRVLVDVAGEAVPTLCPEDAMLHLAVHGRAHRWSHWKWVCDVAQALTLPLDWVALRKRAARHGWRRTLLVSLEVARRRLGVKLPAAIEDACRADPAVALLAAATLETPDADAFRRDATGSLLEEFRYRDTVSARAAFAAGKLLASLRPGQGGRAWRPVQLYRRYGLDWVREIW